MQDTNSNRIEISYEFKNREALNVISDAPSIHRHILRTIGHRLSRGETFGRLTISKRLPKKIDLSWKSIIVTNGERVEDEQP